MSDGSRRAGGGGPRSPIIWRNGVAYNIAENAPVPTSSGGASFDPSTTYEFYDDFDSNSTAVSQCKHVWGTNNNGTGNSTAVLHAAANNYENHPGVVRMQTGTTTSGRASLYYMSEGLNLNGGPTHVMQWLCYIHDLADATNNYEITIGFGDLPGAPNQTDGCYFHYNGNGAANWLAVTASSNSRTETDTGVAVVADDWIRLILTIDGTNGDATYSINGTTVVSDQSTNFPAVDRATGYLAGIYKTAGTTNRLFDVDYCWNVATFSADRRTL